MPRRKSNPTKTAADWNAKHAVGTAVHYHPLRGRPEHRETTTRSAAWVMGGHSAMVMVEGVSGGVSLDHVVAV